MFCFFVCGVLESDKVEVCGSTTGHGCKILRNLESAGGWKSQGRCQGHQCEDCKHGILGSRSHVYVVIFRVKKKCTCVCSCMIFLSFM